MSQPSRRPLRGLRLRVIENPGMGDRIQRNAHLGRERLLELVLAITYYNHVVRVAAVLKLDIDEQVKLPMDRYPPPARIGAWR